MMETESSSSNSEEVYDTSESDDCVVAPQPPARKIRITMTEEGYPLIWDAEEWLTLRRDHRIVGNLIGRAAHSLFSEGGKGLPMALQPWETTLLVTQGVIELIYYPELSQAPGEEVKEQFDSYRERIMQEQIDLLHEERKKEIINKLEDITEGKNKKVIGKPKKRELRSNSKRTEAENGASTSTNASVEADKARILQEELLKVKPPSSGSTMVQIPTKCPWLPQSGYTMDWPYPSNRKENLKYCVFEDLWERGYFVTSGEKFGCDFLVYPGDPCKFHAHYLVVCVEKDARIRPSEVATLCRLGISVHKTAVFAFIMDNEVMYHSITWDSNESD